MVYHTEKQCHGGRGVLGDKKMYPLSGSFSQGPPSKENKTWAICSFIALILGGGQQNLLHSQLRSFYYDCGLARISFVICV